MKRTLLELGGKSPNVIFADADRAKALASAMSVWTFHSGQICIAGTRVLVEASIYDEFTAQLAAAAPRLKIGPPEQEGVAIGPLVSAAQRERVERYIARGVEEGATLACGGKRPRASAERLLHRADAVHRRAQRHDHRARGDLRPGDHRHPVPRRGRGDRHRQRLRLRPLRLRVDAATRRAACASPARCAPAPCRSTAAR